MVLHFNSMSSAYKKTPFKEKYTQHYLALCMIAAVLLIFGCMLVYFVADVLCQSLHLIHSKNSMVHETHPEGSVLSCYYNTPDTNISSLLQPSDVPINLCTHLNVAFARVVNKQIYLEENQIKVLKELVHRKLTGKDQNQKILISVGGSGNDNGFPEMIANHASRKVFIKSIKYILQTLKLDGIDLDWEFPGFRNNTLSESNRDRQHFSQLLYEIRKEYIREKRPYLLTVAVPAEEYYLDVSYDMRSLQTYVDYINVMTYDFHHYSELTPFTGLNSPLYARRSEDLYLAYLNINYTVHMLNNKGMDKSKIVIGIPTYGHTFTLINERNTGIGSPASGPGHLGENGFVNYPDICLFRNRFNYVVVEVDPDAKVPYMYKNQEWVSYDDISSVSSKATFAVSNGLRGAMIYSLNADDFNGSCKGERFPLTRAVHRTAILRMRHSWY